MEKRIRGVFRIRKMSEDKVIVKFNGGLGNQMFQWALARMIKETTEMEVCFDGSYFDKSYARPYQLDIFEIKPEFVEDPMTKLKLNIIWALRSVINWPNFLGYTLYSEPHFHFDKNIIRIKPNTYIEGYFQSELYFNCVERKLREDFTFREHPDRKNQEMIDKIKSTNSISLHVRRGDYVQKKRFKDMYAECSLDYYKRGVEHIANGLENPTLFVFSDDIDWARDNITLPYKRVFVNINSGETSYEDMRLMSLCQHNIIANSSFSWWGAWLNKNPEKIVIAPEKWFNDDKIIQTDVIPKSWVRIAN